MGHLNDCMEASRRDNTWVFVRKDIVEDALALLKEQPEVVMCWQCRRNNECSIQFKFAPADNPGDWFCGYGKRKEGR